MADAPQLDRPGVEVSQEFRSATPTILSPAMPACIVGPANQIVEAVQDDGTLNSDALLAMPARLVTPFISTPFQLTSCGGKTLGLEVNNAAEETVSLPGTNPTITEVADAINEAAIDGIVAMVETSGSQERLVIYTTGTGENASIRVGSSTHATILSVFSITAGYTYVGSNGYMNVLHLAAQLADYPDPRSNLDDLDIDFSTLRLFINPGSGSAFEALRTEGFLLGAGTAVTVQDDGDGDNLSPYLNFASANFRSAAAALTGTADLTSTFGSFGTGTLIMKVDGSVMPTVTFASPGSAAAVVTAINTAWSGTYASLDASNQLVITSTTTGVGSSVERTGGSVAANDVGFATGAYAAGRCSKARAQGTVDLTGLTYSSAVQGKVLRMSLNGDAWQTLTFSTSVTSAATLVSAINALWGSDVAALNAANNLVITAPSDFGGTETCIRIDTTASTSALLTSLGLTTSGGPFETSNVVRGNPMPPLVGDEVWVDGVRIGTITELPTASSARLRVSAEQLLTFTGSSWFIVAKGLDNSVTTATRPGSNLVVDENTGTVKVRHEIFHSTAGVPTVAGPLGTYLAYNALRRDVSPAKADGGFNLLRIGSLTDLADQLSPIDTQNPLGLGMYFAMLNAPGFEVTGCGVDETSTTAPEGTLDAYARAFEYLESKGVYVIAPLTHSSDVGQLAKTHVDAMSEPGNNLERVVILNPERPTRVSSTLIASSATGNVAGAPTDDVQTGLANLQALLAAAGLPGPSYTEDDMVYLEFEDDTNKYLVQSVSNGVVTINNGPLLDNDDGFFYDGEGNSVFSEAVVDRPFTIQVRGAAVANRTEEATAYADIARGYLDRRVIVTAPSQAKASIDGLETVVEGYYLAAGLAGRKSAKAPQQPLTEDALTGFSGVVGSQDRYSEIQLRIMSGGGLWIFYQETDSSPVRTRQQLTSDVSTLLVREDSITQALDYAAALLRDTLRTFTGRFNITTDVKDALAIVCDGIRDFLIRNGVFQTFDVVSITQNEDEQDALDVIVDVTTLKPLNKIRVTMRVA